MPNAFGSLLQTEVRPRRQCDGRPAQPWAWRPPGAAPALLRLPRRLHTPRGAAPAAAAGSGPPTWRGAATRLGAAAAPLGLRPLPSSGTTILEQDLFYSSYTLSVFHNTDKFLSSDGEAQLPRPSAKRLPTVAGALHWTRGA